MVIFKSSASANLILLDSLARDLLGLIGKSLSARGIIRHEELPSAIERLEMAIATEKRERGMDAQKGEKSGTQHATENETEDDFPPLRLAQRAFPLLELLRAAQREGTPVLWGV